ncbi:hypothetical protein BVRB_1g004870 [Beta vulgaris subsp. vulgaris]|nr:hypothetical protein BVRB_1g004870 [Beta vulgaris subsp. vulgaris]
MSYYAFIIVLLTISTNILHTTNAQTCNPSKPLIGIQAPADQCDPNGADCCKAGRSYTTYKCSPPVTKRTQATLTLNSFEEGGDGGGASACDEKFHSDNTPVVALSTGWYNGRSRCGKEIVITGNGKTTRAKVVDECDSMNGCDEEHGYQLPCKNNIVDASKAVWKALGVSRNSDLYGMMPITWTDA